MRSSPPVPRGPRLRPWVRLAMLLAVGLALGSCFLDMGPDRGFTLQGRLGDAFGCTVVSAGGKNYEVHFESLPVPPLGAYVVLRVEPIRDAFSVCMVGEMVRVTRVVRVVTDFRTAPVVGAETWSRASGPIVLGKVEVLRGARLTILPGADVTILPYGELRVRGILQMVGVPGDSVRVRGPDPGGLGCGWVVLDSAQAGTRIAWAVVPLVLLRGDAPQVADLRAADVGIAGGRASLLRVSTPYLHIDSGSASADASALGEVEGVHAQFTLRNCTLAGLSLSYSRADVADSRFQGSRSYVLFHGPSGGTFQRNAFVADETTIEVRHTSDPVFTDNDLVSPVTEVICGSYQLATCIHMEQNWWGSANEADVRSHVQAGCPVCVSPWRTTPYGAPPAL